MDTMAEMQNIRWFSDLTADQVNLVGGKGANLGEMVRKGFPVPPGFCVVAPSYGRFIELTGLDSSIRDVLKKTDMQDDEDKKSNAAQIQDLIKAKEIPPEIATEVLAGYRQLCKEFNIENLPVATRSSATAEDLPGASFAGQHDTYLNVCGEKALLDHVIKCWASLWNEEAMDYREKRGFDHQKVLMSVVVQAMIPSEVSGVLFTGNPLNGDREQMLLNASWGLGEAIVSGQTSPDTFLLRKEDGSILHRQMGAKELIIAYGEDGGIVEVETPPEQRAVYSITDEQVADLAGIARKVEDHYVDPQDIEWGYANDRMYLLQSRPITPPFGDDEFNRSMFIEIFPDPMTPIFCSVMKPLLNEMLDHTFDKLGFERPSQDIEPIGIYYNQPYMNRHYIDTALAPLSDEMRQAFVDLILNPFRDSEEAIPVDLSLPFLRMIAGFLRFMTQFSEQMPDLVAQYQAVAAKVEAFPLESASDTEIIDLIHDFLFNSANKLIRYDFLLILASLVMYSMLARMLEGFYGEKTEEVVAQLVSGVTGNITMETNKHIWDLAQMAKGSATISDMLREGDERTALAQLKESPEAKEFIAALDSFLAEYGHREIRVDIFYPTWREDPAPVVSFMRSYLDADESQSPHRQEARLKVERQELTAQVLAQVSKDPISRFIRLPIFRWLLGHAQAHTRERDTMHFELTRLFPPCRRLLHEMGKRWAGLKIIDRPDDIYFILLEELYDIADSPRSLIEEVSTRRAEFEANQKRPIPDIIRGSRESDSAPMDSRDEGDALKGVAGSPGRVTGVSRVIRGPHEFGKLQKGEILVAPLTTPIWTPLFAIAGGVITEVGGILSHGAIVAREYGIPAVMAVPRATTLLEDGMPITVDGNKGAVYLENVGAE
jgi:pyruvate,water dikinase